MRLRAGRLRRAYLVEDEVLGLDGEDIEAWVDVWTVRVEASCELWCGRGERGRAQYEVACATDEGGP